MVCVSINSRTKFDGHDYFYDFWSSVVDGRYAQGGWQTGNHTVGQWGFVSEAASNESAIQRTLSYLGGNWKNVYGVDMKRTDICGQESVWICEQPLNGYETDQYGTRRPNPACNPPQIGNISFTSTPSGAEIFLDGTDQGVMTPNTAMNVPAGDHSYVLKLAGYNDYTGTVSVVTGQTAAVSATLIAACIPVWKCEIPLTGYETDGCGNRRANPACNPPPACVPGWKCEFPLTGYETDGCGNKRPNPACNPPQTGNISFVSTPAGAGIFLDGHDQGAITPNTVSGIPAGIHAYTLKLAGYNDYTGSIDVTLNQTAAVTATLIAVCTPVWKCEFPLNGYETDGCGNRRANPACNLPQTGSMSFTSTPAGAEIFIDGADQGAVTPYTISNIPVGVHTYTLKMPGYNDITGTVSVTSNQTASVPATLIPSVPPTPQAAGGGGMMIMVGLLVAGAVVATILRKGEKTTIIAQRRQAGE